MWFNLYASLTKGRQNKKTTTLHKIELTNSRGLFLVYAIDIDFDVTARGLTQNDAKIYNVYICVEIQNQ